MDPFDPSAFTSAVDNFKTFFKKNPSLYSVGQFYLTGLATNSLLEAIKADLANDPCLKYQSDIKGVAYVNKQPKTMIEIIFDAIKSHVLSSLNPTPDTKDDLAKVRLWLTDSLLAGGCDLSRYWQQYFQPAAPKPSDTTQAQGYFATVWKSDSIDGPPPVALSPTYRLLTAVHQIEQLKCFDVATGMADKFLNAQGAKPSVPRSAAISSGIVGRACLVNFGAAATDTTLQLQNVRYQISSDLANTVAKIGKVLNAGGVLRCGVVSGVQDKTQSSPERRGGLLPCTVRYPDDYVAYPEHFLLIFGQGTVNDLPAFVFWDPDSARSRFGALNWGSGFGCLFSQGGRLSTAISDSDLVAVNTQVKSRFQGDHTNPPPSDVNRRHRYQVYSVASLPPTLR